MEEIKLVFGNCYMNVIHFGTGSETMIMISGVSLTGLEGQGESIAEAYQTLAEDINQAMEMLGMKDAFVYGVSQGAMIAKVLALKYPEKVKKLVLCSTMCRPTSKIKNVARKWLEPCTKL